MFFNSAEGIAVFKITKGEKEVWVEVEKGANDAVDLIVAPISNTTPLVRVVTNQCHVLFPNARIS